MLVGFITSIIGYMSLLSFFKALTLNKVGIITPIANTSLVFTLILSAVFLHKRLSYAQYFAIAFIFVGILFVAIKMKNTKSFNFASFVNGSFYALATALLWGVNYVIFDFLVQGIGPFATSFISEAGILMLAFVHIIISSKNFYIDTKVTRPVFATAFFGVIGLLSFNIGLDVADIGIIAALSAANPLVSTILARIVYKEKMKIINVIAASFIVTGIVLLTFLTYQA
jgi:drug/metabolite transporter (DMT)-like permease